MTPRRTYTFVQEAFLREDKGVEVQTAKMLYCPMMGTREPLPDIAAAWREQHQHAWVFNPWTGHQRSPDAIECDPDGRLLLPPGETPTGEWETYILMAVRADGALGQFKRFGWTGKLDFQQLTVKLRKGEYDLTFSLTEPKDEERYYQLLNLEAWRYATR